MNSLPWVQWWILVVSLVVLRLLSGLDVLEPRVHGSSRGHLDVECLREYCGELWNKFRIKNIFLKDTNKYVRKYKLLFQFIHRLFSFLLSAQGLFSIPSKVTRRLQLRTFGLVQILQNSSFLLRYLSSLKSISDFLLDSK